VFGVDPKTLFFTSGGTEADNLVLLSLLLAAENAAWRSPRSSTGGGGTGRID
jgi:cysteine sulfinate desulfinase/cysteine desulfurase-like protein